MTGSLKQKSWAEEEMILNQFGVPVPQHVGDRDDLRNWRLQVGSDDVLHALWMFLVSPGGALAPAAEADMLRLWGHGSPRVFLSHKGGQTYAAELKTSLAAWQAAAFVAHDDIEPTLDWQSEIERALSTMDVLVALLTEGFALSPWTNQEVGVALGRGVPVISVSIAEHPRGFIGSAQSTSGHGRSVPEVACALIQAMTGYPSLAEPMLLGLVRQWESVSSFAEGGRVMALLDSCKAMPAHLLERIEKAYRENDQLHRATSVNNRYGPFLARMKRGASGAA